ncbi:hypothetical protein [Geminicoccus roseus]|uniref:hypothetical protein n=1 Tax=Geminicoccus roseus TaxID=404900 RepID=UPI000408E531|nr:hypothetical protein [Geminicoccus roseus]
MWIMLKDAFFSVVDKAVKPGCLVVRARRPGDIERYFPGAEVRQSTSTDYMFRAEIEREHVAQVIGQAVMDIDAPNFKASVKDRRLHDAYLRVWHAMATLQPTAPLSGTRARDDHGSHR